MKDYGINKGEVQSFDTSDRRTRGAFFGFRKMFYDYLNKLHVPFQDPCCEDAPTDLTVVPQGFDITTGEAVYWDATSESWLPLADWASTTTTTTTTSTSTTTTSSSTTTTTTAA